MNLTSRAPTSVGVLLCWMMVAGCSGFFCKTAEATSLRLYAPDLHPFAGEQVEGEGVLIQITRMALAPANDAVDVGFYPRHRVRAQALADGVELALVVGFEPKPNDRWLYSDAIMPVTLSRIRLREPQAASANRVTPLRVGVVRGWRPQVDFSVYGGEVEVVEASYTHQLLQMLEQGRLDEVILEESAAADTLIEKIPLLIGQLEIRPIKAPIYQFYLAINRADAAAERWLSQFNTELKRLEESGELRSLKARYGMLSDCDLEGDANKLRIASVSNQDMLWMAQLAELYRGAQPELELEWHFMKENTLHRRALANAILDKCQYDIVTLGSYQIPIWAEAGWLAPVTALSDDYDRTDLIEPVVAALTHAGQLYALPFYAESALLYYRADWFKQAGLTMPAQPTYEDIQRFAKHLTDRGQQRYGVCLRTKPDFLEALSTVTMMVNGFGGQWFNRQWMPQLKTEPWRQAVATYVSMVQQWGPERPRQIGYQEALALFASGHCGMWLDATVAAGTLYNPGQSVVASTVRMAPLPSTGRRGARSQWLWVWALAVPSAGHKQAQAHAFIEWATSPAYRQAAQARFGALATPAGTRYSTYKDSRYLAVAPFAPRVLEAITSVEPSQKIDSAQSNQGLQYVSIPEYSAIGTETIWNIYRVVLGKQPLQQALTDSQRFATQALRTRIRQQARRAIPDTKPTGSK